jgi:hypothetical protein
MVEPKLESAFAISSCLMSAVQCNHSARLRSPRNNEITVGNLRFIYLNLGMG